MTQKITGYIKAISQREKNYSIDVDGTWFSNFGRCGFRKGDFISLSYTMSGDGRWKNITNISLATPTEDEINRESKKNIKSDNKEVIMLTSYAKDILVAEINKGKIVEMDKLDTYIDHLSKVTTRLYKKIQEELNNGGKEQTSTE